MKSLEVVQLLPKAHMRIFIYFLDDIIFLGSFRLSEILGVRLARIPLENNINKVE